MNNLYETENRKIGSFFYLLAAAQILQIAAGIILGLLVAPASLFVSRTETEAFGWIVLAFMSLVCVALGVILLPLSIIVAIAYRREKRWRKIVGIGTACLAILELPFGTILAGIIGWKIFTLENISLRGNITETEAVREGGIFKPENN